MTPRSYLHFAALFGKRVTVRWEVPIGLVTIYGQMKPEAYTAYNEKRREKYATDSLYREREQRRMLCYANRPEIAEKQRCRSRRVYDDLTKKEAILYSIKKRARASGRDFDLTVENIEWPELCPVLGIKLNYERCGKLRCAQPNSPSVDRFDNSKGYTRNNVHVISLRANRVKNDATADELDAIAKYVRYGLAHIRNPP